MAGIYIHIPLCKTRCSYCDFFATTDYTPKDELLGAILSEIEIRKHYLTENVETIYFGGGTPSTLPVPYIYAILRACMLTFTVENNTEITFEANPDDLTEEYLSGLREIGINRLSIGLQSFDNTQLKIVNRRHNAKTSLRSVKLAHNEGFNNISIDLIFGLPGQSLQSWQSQVDRAVKLNVQHISAYGLTYEEGTPLHNQMRSGRITPADDDTMIEMYRYLIKTAADNGFEQYEISNFAKPGFRSLHNSSYWQLKPYIGIGPSAHSYNGDSRQWNISSVSDYCRNIKEETIFFEKEILTTTDRYNDFVMVGLRTMQGISLTQLESEFGKDFSDSCVKSAKKHIENGHLCIKDDFLRLTYDGILLTDRIIADLMIV